MWNLWQDPIGASQSKVLLWNKALPSEQSTIYHSKISLMCFWALIEIDPLTVSYQLTM